MGVTLTTGVVTDTCWCCGKEHERRIVNDPWDGRMIGYCTDCAANRCDCYPEDCPNKDDIGL